MKTLTLILATLFIPMSLFAASVASNKIVEKHFRQMLGRAPTWEELDYFAGKLDNKEATEKLLIEFLEKEPEAEAKKYPNSFALGARDNQRYHIVGNENTLIKIDSRTGRSWHFDKTSNTWKEVE